LPEHELQTSLIEYPCEFPIKIFACSRPVSRSRAGSGHQARPGFCRRHDGNARQQNRALPQPDLHRARHIAEQLDALYQDLCDHPSIVMVL